MTSNLWRVTVLGLALLICAPAPASELLSFLDEAISVEAKAPKVNINTATREQLCLLPGIGPSRALAIIGMRSKRPFRRKSQLLKIRGIGPKSLIRLRPYVALEGPTTLRAKVKTRR